MNGKTLARIGTTRAVTIATVGLLLAAVPAGGQSPSTAETLAKTSVRVPELTAAHVRLSQSSPLLSAFPGGEVSGRALASADFDEDGVPDLVTGYSDSEGGRITVQRGNVDAIYPNSAEANIRRQRGEFTAAAFHSILGNLTLPEAVDLLGAGDFDADGHWDIVAARNGGTRLYWLRGDGHGNFESAQPVVVGGEITALAAGEVNRVDGLTDLAVGIVGAEGASALVFESAEGAFRREPERFALLAPANSFAFGQLNEESATDLAIASGNEVVVVAGRDRKLSLDGGQQAQVSPATMIRNAFETEVVSIAVGDFAGDSQSELATLLADGSVRLLDRNGVPRQTLRLPASSAPGGAGALQSKRLITAKVSALPKNDLLIVGGSSAVQILTPHEADLHDESGKVTQAGIERLSLAAVVEGGEEVSAILPMRLNSDALQDLVMLTRDGAPRVIETVNNVFVVTTTARTQDAAPGNGVCADAAGNCSFPAAIEESNASPGPHTIHFNIPGGGVPIVSTHIPNCCVRNELHNPVTIDGTTQPGGRVEINSDGFIPLIFYGGNSVLRGVAVYGQGASIVLASDSNILEGNYIGFRPDGSKPSFGDIGGIEFRGGINSSRPGNNNLVGGTTAQARNVISNCSQALNMRNNTGNVLQGNWVGLTVDGTAAFPNGGSLNAGDSTVTVGGATAGAGNVFAGATNQGTFAVGLNIGRASLIQGNKIGTSADGMQVIPMRGNGIIVFTNEAVTIGGTTPAARNIFAGCFWGVRLEHDGGEATVVQGNYIGTNAAGTGALPNSETGMILTGTRGAVIGGTAPGAGNLISGNTKNGLELFGGINGTPCRNVVIQGNLIGTNASGTVALPNKEFGIYLNVIDNVQLGGTSAGARNVISGNTRHGLVIGDVRGIASRVQGNFIGLNIFGTGALGNGQHGIHIEGTGGHLIGGTGPGAGNLIAFNSGAGIASSFRDYLGGSILSNSIFANQGLGLDRVGDGPTPFRNSYSEAPVITSVNSSTSETVISGNFRTQTFGPQTTYTIQFFSNPNSDPSGYGEGQTFIGQTTVTAGQNAVVPFSATITPAVSAGRWISAVAVGVYDTANNGIPLTSEFSFNVRAPGDPSSNPLALSNLTPATAGNLGDATITVFGEGIAEGATIVLRRSGRPDISAQSFVVGSNGNGILATFALSGQELGAWDIVVTNPDGSTRVLAGAFTIVQGVDAQPWVDVIGREAARPGRPQVYHVVFGNRANTDAYGVPLRVSMPLGTSFRILSKTGLVTLDHIDPNHEAYDEGQDISQYDSFIDTEQARVLLMVLPTIPANTSGIVAIEMTFPDQGETGRVEASIGQPLLESTVTAMAASGTGKIYAVTSPSDLPPEVRRLRDKAAKALGAAHIKSNGDVDIAYFEAQKKKAQDQWEDTYSADARKALAHADAQLAKALALQGLISTAKGAKDVVDAKDQVVGGPVGWVKDKIKGWALDKAFKAIKNAGDIPEILKDMEQKLVEPILDEISRTEVKIIRWVRSLDPNDKVGSAGSGTEHFITGEEPIPYAVFFENKETASAPAQTVVITDQLDTTKLDVNTFQLGPIVLGAATVLVPPQGVAEWTTDADLRPANNLIVRVSGFLDKTTGLATWRFTSIDPATGQPTDEPTAGFLPPNKIAPEGQGSVLFTIQPKANQPEGTQIRNKARIVFDENAPIDTPEWLNTVDRTRPSSQVLALPATNSLARFEVQWTGSDAVSGIARYTIYVSENGGAFVAWLVNTTTTSAFFEGRPNTAYSFYSVAEDGAGNVELPPGPGDASTSTLAGQLLNIATRLRVQTGENVLIGGVIVTGTEPKKVILRAIGPSLSQFFSGALADPKLELYHGNMLLAENDNWKDSQQAEIEATTIPPANELESAIVRTLAPGFYTAIVSGKNSGTGIAIVEAYDLDQDANSKLANISTRGFVEGGENVMIGGLIVGGKGGANTRVVVRAIGPSLANAGITGALQDPTLELRDTNGGLVRVNDNWQETQQEEIEATTIPPGNAAEPAIVTTLTPGNYTAIVRGKNGATGVAVVEVYNVQ